MSEYSRIFISYSDMKKNSFLASWLQIYCHQLTFMLNTLNSSTASNFKFKDSIKLLFRAGKTPNVSIAAKPVNWPQFLGASHKIRSH
jgi:hypothetical protein